MSLDQPTCETMNRINAAIAQAMELCPRPELVSWGRRWISGDDRSRETVASIAAAIGVVNVPPDPFARELQEAGRRALMPDELFDWTTKGAVLAALEWTRADPKLGNYHEKLAARIRIPGVPDGRDVEGPSTADRATTLAGARRFAPGAPRVNNVLG